MFKLLLGKGSFFKPHVDTPRSERMFGSLVVVFPTPHEGGALFLRHHGHEWVFDSSKALEALDEPTIGYVAFFSDIEHEVAPVTSGHRITLTYNLYFDDDGHDDAVSTSKHHIPPRPSNQEGFCEAFKALLENPEFMADGGTLAFGLRHVYPIKGNLKHVYNVLKGSDAVVYQSMRTLGYEPVLYVYYDDDINNNDKVNKDEGEGEDYSNPSRGVVVDRLMDFGRQFQECSVLDAAQEEGGIPVYQVGCTVTNTYEDPEPVEWVTPLTKYNRQEGAFAYCGNEASLFWVYGDVCMIVRIGKAGDRLGFPTAAQLRSAYLENRESLYERDFL